MIATASSRQASKASSVVVRMAIGGASESIFRAVREIKVINRWPAVRLAVSRTPRASGRMSRLTVSIKIRAGIRGPGVPRGNI